MTRWYRADGGGGLVQQSGSGPAWSGPPAGISSGRSCGGGGTRQPVRESQGKNSGAILPDGGTVPAHRPVSGLTEIHGIFLILDITNLYHTKGVIAMNRIYVDNAATPRLSDTQPAGFCWKPWTASATSLTLGPEAAEVP